LIYVNLKAVVGMNAQELLTNAREAIQGTNADVARRLGITRQVLHMMEKGSRPIPDRLAQDLANLAGLDPAATVAALHAERADPTTKRVWEEIARRASLTAALLLGLSALPPPDSHGMMQTSNTLFVYYVKSLLLLTLLLRPRKHARCKA
jgi:DNA-binding XRE family transcriptional regulator